ncbi:hypothetical protein CSUI_009581 [Cystoisospora suis]|uniref:F-box domain-containing protein n=1 Tax=Cystoisospora suis TaxID=483139 RepID=A0A2C6KJL6_9APIC|nr:hypothetical protein CSUI_009581 [Cystoisospora suis]
MNVTDPHGRSTVSRPFATPSTGEKTRQFRATACGAGSGLNRSSLQGQQNSNPMRRNVLPASTSPSSDSPGHSAALQQPEVVAQLLECLPWRDRRTLARVCRSWSEAADQNSSWRDVDATFTDGKTALLRLASSGRQRLCNRFPGRLTQTTLPFRQRLPPFLWISRLQLSVYSSQQAAELLSLLLFPGTKSKRSGSRRARTQAGHFNAAEDGFSAQEADSPPSFSLPLLQRLDLYRGLGPPDSCIFRIETPVHILTALPSPTPTQHLPETLGVETFCDASTVCGSSPCTSSTGTGPSSPTRSVPLSPPWSAAQGHVVDSPVFSGFPSGSSRRDSVSSMSEIALPESRVVCQSLSPQTSSSEAVASLSDRPSYGCSSCLSGAALSESGFGGPASQTPPLLSAPSTSPVGILPQAWVPARHSRLCPPELEVDMRAQCAQPADSKDASSLCSSRLDEETPGLASLAFLECLVLEVPLPAVLLQGLCGRLPRLRHLCVTQLMPNSHVRGQARGSVSFETEETEDLERIHALEDFIRTLPPQQLRTLCVNFSCVSTPSKLFGAGGHDVSQGEEEFLDEEPLEGELWGEVVQRAQKAAALSPASLSSDCEGLRGGRSGRGRLNFLEEDGDDLMELLAEKHHESLQYLWFADIPASYAKLHKFLARCRQLSSWHLAGWAALMAAAGGLS